ncbi:MAG: hypothetical protein E6J83_10935 [Deltaproteobacteria bacterium]|nr:MAG: hypothetical protein E6J83_10935 [Deltaproteobacteria bacterium]
MRLQALTRRQDAVPPEGTPELPGPTPPWRRLWRLPTRMTLRDLVRHNRGLKLVSIFLAFFLWFSINVSERDAERVVELPVAIRRLQPGLIVTNLPAKPIRARLRGPRTILEGVDEHKVRLAPDLSSAMPGDLRLDLAGDMVRPDLPRRLKVVSVEPARLKLHVERLAQRNLPVRVEVAGMPATGYKPKPSAVPDHVEVRGPASKLDDLKEIATEPVDVSGASATVQRSVLLSWAGDFVTFAPDHVTVTVAFEEEMMRREFRGVDVRVLHIEGARAQLFPARIDVVIRGPQHVLHNYELGDGAAYVDAAGLVPGTYRVSARVDLPPSLELVRQRPDPLTLHISPPEGAH